MGNMGLVVLEEFIHDRQTDRQNSRLLYRLFDSLSHPNNSYAQTNLGIDNSQPCMRFPIEAAGSPRAE